MPNEFSKISAQLPTPLMAGFSLLRQFEGFIGFWLQLKRELMKHITGQQAFSYEEGVEITDIALYKKTKLILFTEQQRGQVPQVTPSQQRKFYEQALYATISMIDEQLLQRLVNSK
jgi:hypothetical protein